MRKTVHILFILVIVLSGFAGVIILTPSNTRAYTPHDPIEIDGDADFAVQAVSEGWAGNGTSENPFIIEGYEINTSDAIGIEIMSTTVHFIIKDSYIGCDGSGFQGIYFTNVTNVTINNCTLENNSNGIEIWHSSDIFLKNNLITNGFTTGIFLWNSTDCNVTGNIVTGYGHGIRIGWSRSNIILDNTVLSNKYYGIYLSASSGNIIINNNASKNSRRGMSIAGSDKNNIINNTFSSNELYGIIISHSDWNNISGNTISSNNRHGIYISNSSWNNISHNIISNNKYGIYLVPPEDNTISDNSFSNNEHNIFYEDDKGEDYNPSRHLTLIILIILMAIIGAHIGSGMRKEKPPKEKETEPKMKLRY